MKSLRQKIIWVSALLMFVLNINTSLLLAEETPDSNMLQGQWESTITTDSGVEYNYNFDFYQNGEVLITRKSVNEPGGEIDQLLTYSVSSFDEMFKGAIKIDLETDSEGNIISRPIKEFENLIIEKDGSSGYILMFDENAPDESLVGKQMQLKKVSDKHLYETKEAQQAFQDYLNGIWFPITLCIIVSIIGTIIILVIRNNVRKKAMRK